MPALAWGTVAAPQLGDEEAEGPYQPKLSKHEKQLMQRARERHQANITTKQVRKGEKRDLLDKCCKCKTEGQRGSIRQ